MSASRMLAGHRDDRFGRQSVALGLPRSDFSYGPFEPVFARKDANAAGLQLADLVGPALRLERMRRSSRTVPSTR